MINPYCIPGLKESSILIQVERSNTGTIPVTKENILIECIRIMNRLNKTSYKMEDVMSKSRVKELVEIRHFASYHLRNILNIKWTSIGRFLGNRDHSTAINSFNQWDDWSSQKYNKEIHKANKELMQFFDLKPITDSKE